MNKMESIGEQSADQKEIDKWFKETTLFLKRHGISNLTNIELFNLRKDIEYVSKENKRLENGRMDKTGRRIAGFNLVSPISEVTSRFFLHYGINSGDFPWGEKGIDDRNWEYIKRAINKAREEDHKP